MKWGIQSGVIDSSLPYAAEVQEVAQELDFPAKFLYAIAWRESIREYGTNAAGKTSDNGDGGYGLFQLTVPWAEGIEWPPADWYDAATNARLAVQHYLDVPDNIQHWVALGFEGEDLIRLAAATFNAGLGNWYGPRDPRNCGARGGHGDGDVDLYTTNRYASGVLAIYRTLVASAGLPS